MRKLGNLTAADLGRWVTAKGSPPFAGDPAMPEIHGRIDSIEHHYGDDGSTPVVTLLLAATRIDDHEIFGLMSEWVTRVPDWPCTTEGGHQ